MDATTAATKPHAVCIPVPIQSHIKATLKFAKILHSRGFHITFINTEFNHKRFLKSLGPDSLNGLPDFRFEAIPDGVPDSDEDATQNLTLLCDSILKRTFLALFPDLLTKLNNDAKTTSNNPPVTCIVSDGFMSPVTITAGQDIGVPQCSSTLLLHVPSWALYNFVLRLKKDLHHSRVKYIQLLEQLLNLWLILYLLFSKHANENFRVVDESCLTNGYLEKIIDWIPGMKDIRLRDLPTFFRTTNPDGILFNFTMKATDRAHEASAIVLHTFDALETDVLDALSSMLPLVYPIGPLQLHLNQIPEHLLNTGYSLWKEETECLEWLNAKAPDSVMYVNFGSIAVMTPENLVEFGWGLANSKLPFLWVIRPDLVIGESAILPPEFVAETKERSLIASWCPQDQVLNHPSCEPFFG